MSCFKCVLGKGESIWDVYCHTPGNIFNDDTGDIACDSYHKIAEDVEALKKLGVCFFKTNYSNSLPTF